MYILLLINKIIERIVKLLDEAPWYTYGILVLIILLLLLVKPFFDLKRKKSEIKRILESNQGNFESIDLRLFVRENLRMVAKNKISIVINNIEKLALGINDDDLYKQVIHLASRFEEENEKRLSGQIDLSNTIEINRLKASLIEILASIEKSNG